LKSSISWSGKYTIVITASDLLEMISLFKKKTKTEQSFISLQSGVAARDKTGTENAWIII